MANSSHPDGRRAPLTRRRVCGGLIAGATTLVAAGCAPVISPQREQELGREEAREVEQTVGLLRDGALVGYVRQVGGRLAQAAGRPDIGWQFEVADDGEPNAFALPGGWVYVTRGVLSLTNSEDELAGVLGHEMAHVLERHAVRRVERAMPLAVLFGVAGGVLGGLSSTLGGIVDRTGQLASGLVLAPYSREQEHEADRGGIQLAARAGWHPSGLATFLRTLDRQEALAGRDPARRSFFATHPTTPDRVRDVEAAAHALTPGPPAPGNRGAFVGRFQGLVVGDNPAHGVFLGTLFVHPELDLAMEMPARWTTVNGRDVAGAVAPTRDAAMLLHVAAEGDDPIAGARADGVRDEHLPRLQRLTISGLPALTLIAEGRDGERLGLTWIAHRTRVVRVTAVTSARDWDLYRPTFDGATRSVRPLRPADRERIVESRLRIRTAGAGERLPQVLARGGSAWTPARTAVANGIDVNAALESGWPVKVAVSERYVPR